MKLNRILPIRMKVPAAESCGSQTMAMTFVGGTSDLQVECDSTVSNMGTNSWGVASNHPSEPILSPKKPQNASTAARLPLALAANGDRAWVAEIKGGHRMVRRLTDLGIAQGSEITIINRTDSGSVIVGLQGCRIGIGAGMAHRVMVAIDAPDLPATDHEPTVESHPHGTSAMPPSLHLGDLKVGQSGHIVGYETGQRAYRQKLLSMGLTPGTHFTVTRHAPLGDPIEIEVRGFKLSLRKGEAAALKVDPIEAGTP
jgi:ferrous iron transport protein A